MKTFSLLCLVLAFTSVSAQNLSVEQTTLQDLALQTQTIETINSYRGKALLAQASSLPGQAYALKSPINVQQIRYLKGSGASIAEGEAFAVLQGPEVHHFYMAYQMKKELYNQARAHFENSKALYKRKSLSEKAWLDVSNEFHDTKMEFDELNHFFELVVGFDEEKDAMTLASPIDGSLEYSGIRMVDANSLIASFVPNDAMRIKLKLPIDGKQNPEYFIAKNCQFALDFSEVNESAFYLTAWAQLTSGDCRLVKGQIVSATPVYSLDAYKAKKSAVFSWEGANYIFIKTENGFDGVEVSLINAQNDNYVFQSKASLVNKDVLVSSVSALQGILLGLGQ